MKFLRWVAIAVGLAMALAIVCIAAAPTILSTSLGRKACLTLASRACCGTVNLKTLEVGWLSGVDLQGLQVTDSQGRQRLSCARLALKKPLLSLLVSREDFGLIAIDSPELFCYAETAQDTSSHSPKEPRQRRKEGCSPLKTPSVRGKVDITNARLIAMSGKQPVGQLCNGTVALNLDLLHASTGNASGDLSLQGAKPAPLSLSFALDGAPDLARMTGSFSFSCQDVPTEFLAALARSVDPQIGDVLKEAFGPKLSYSVSASLNGPNAALHSVLDSGNLRSDVHVRIQDSVATISQGPLLTGTITPRLFGLLHVEPVSLLAPAAFAVENNSPLSVRLNPVRLTAPMDLRCSNTAPLLLSPGKDKPPITVGIDSLFRGDASALGATLSMNAASETSSAALGLAFSATPKEDGSYLVAAKTTLNGQWPTLLEAASGLPLSSLVGETFSGEATCTDLVIDAAGGLVLSSPAIMTCAIAPHPLPNGLQLSHPIDLSVTVMPFSLLRTGGALKGSPIKAVLQSGEISLADHPPLGPYLLSVPVTVDIDQQQIKADPVIKSQGTPIITGTAAVHLPKEAGRSPTAECSLTLEKLPTALLEAALGRPLAPLIGESLSSSTSCTFNGWAEKGNTLSCSLSGPFWKAQGRCALDAMKLSGTKALEFEGTFSPAWVAALSTSDLSIAQPVTVHGSVPQLSADLSSFLAPSGSASLWELLETVRLSASLSLSSIEVKQQSTSIGRLSPATAACDIGKGHVDFSLSAPAGTPEALSLAAQGSCDGLWNRQGLTLSASHIRSTVDIDRFPTRILEFISPGNGKLFEEAIGPTIRLTGAIAVDELKSGTATVDVSAKNCSAHCDGRIQDGTLTLTTPANASLAITKDAGAALLKNVNPLLATAVSSEKPIHITVDSKGAAIPLRPFSLTQVELPSITADIGKIVVKNGGALKGILAVLGMGDANGGDLDVWLTPLYLNFHKGTLTCRRADALVADKLHMITWGDIDLGRDRINMVIAIPEESLARLRLKIMTPTPERGLQIPITGSPSHPDIDTKRATARLAGAGIMNNVPDKRLQILGGLIQAAATAVGEPDQPIPSPTTSPLPWERARQ